MKNHVRSAQSVAPIKDIFFFILAILSTATISIEATGAQGYFKKVEGQECPTGEAVTQSKCETLANGWTGISWNGTVSRNVKPTKCFLENAKLKYNSKDGNGCASSTPCICACPAGSFNNMPSAAGSCSSCDAGE